MTQPRNFAPIYQALADGKPLKVAADVAGVSEKSIATIMSRHRKTIGARTSLHALAIMIKRGTVAI